MRGSYKRANQFSLASAFYLESSPREEQVSLKTEFTDLNFFKQAG